MDQLQIFDLINIDSLIETEKVPNPQPVTQPNSFPGLTVQVNRSKPQQHISIFSKLIALVGQMRQELERNPEKLLQLNRGRRSQIISYLEYLMPQSGTHYSADDCLKKWIENIKTPGQSLALRIYFEDLALFFLCEVLIAKRWSDLGLFKIEPNHLKNLNWNLANHLKPHCSHEQEGWQFTKPNIYSWFTPSQFLIDEIWLTVEKIDLSTHDFQTLQQLVKNHRQFVSDKPEWKSYDPRWFEVLWNELLATGFKPVIELGSVFKRQAQIFCPTIREGSLIRSAPKMTWIGVESNPLLLSLAEFSLLWSGPQSSPLWSQNNGLDCIQSDQLNAFQSTDLISNNKSVNLQKISEMEAFDLSFVIEEQSIRLGQKTREAQNLKNQLEQSNLDFSKKLRGQKTSLGTLQACLSVSKLRQGGLLIWTREEPLSAIEGTPALQWLLDRMILQTEVSLASIEHTLPTDSPLFPKYIYVFKRECILSTRSESRPEQLSMSGTVKSHIELPLFLEDAIKSALTGTINSHSSWKTSKRVCPIPQKDWAQNWPNPTGQDTLDSIEKIKANSVLLGSLVRVLNIHQTTNKKENEALFISVSSNKSQIGNIYFNAELQNENLVTFASIYDGTNSTNSIDAGVLISTPNPSQRTWICEYLKRKPVKIWIEHFAERKNGKIILSENLIKSIPVPKDLVDERLLEHDQSENYQDFFVNHEKTSNLIEVISSKIRGPARTTQYTHSVFYKLSQIYHEYLKEIASYKNMISENSDIIWSEFIKLLPAAQWTPISYSEQVTISGHFPLHIPISRIVDNPSIKPGFIIFSEAGHQLSISITDSLILKIISQQIQLLKTGTCTWSEILGFVRTPRNLDLVRQTANDILKAYGDRKAVLAKVDMLMTNCLDF